MSMDPHWISTLFGAYHFVKAFYVGLGALIILAAIVHLQRGQNSGLTANHFHDVGKLFLAFCLLWADFFYVQLNVIWYGNIPEETHYVILRTMLPPWRGLAWTVFIVCFIVPFVVLLNKRVKTMPNSMIALSALVILGIWLEHLLLLGPALSHDAAELPLGITDGLVFTGFLGLMVLALAFTFRAFPELLPPATEGTR
jgi:ABC-type xylose transport system permease subunit